MSIPAERWKEWQGRLVDGKFALRQWLGSSDHSAVFLTERFLTERAGSNPQQSVIKLIAAENLDAGAQLSLWAEAAKFSHSHLIRLFAYGRGTIDDTPLLYVVTEYAEENLGEIIPVRALSGDEALEMLRPAAEALAFLQGAGFVHSRIKPSNIMAVGNHLKLSSDGVRKSGQARRTRPLTTYDAPEVAASGFGPAADIWSLGATIVTVLTQKEPKNNSINQEHDEALRRVPERLRRIVQRCLQADPEKRPTADGILQELSHTPVDNDLAVNANVDPHTRQHRQSRRIVLPVVVLAAVLLAALIASKFIGHQRSAQVSKAPDQNSQSDKLSAKSSTAPSPRPSSQPGVVRGSVLNQIMPEVSQNALRTVTGRIKVGVEVAVDTSGNVSSARLRSSGPSKYFSSRAVAAARQWKFNPAQVNGEPVASEWLLRFQFARSSTQVFPTELNP